MATSVSEFAIALLGSRALDADQRDLLELAGTAFAVVSFLPSVFVLAPKRDFLFALVGAVGLWTLALAVQ
jgi:hypothetical protein